MHCWTTKYTFGQRPHGRPQFTFGHSVNKTLKRAGISTDFKEWTELAQHRAGWQKLIY